MPKSNELFELFSPNVYDGGATVLYALRQVIGDRAFRELGGTPDWQPDPVTSTARRSQSAARALERSAVLEKR